MLKKVILGTLFVGMIAFLVVGAINRTQDKSEDTVQAAGIGRGQSRTADQVDSSQPRLDYQSTGGQGIRGGRSTAEFERQYPNYQEPIDEWLTFSGTVTQVPAEGIDLVIETTDGELVVGTGPSALIEHGLEVQEGDELEVLGYWGDDEFKAAEITLLATGQTIVLRDEWGRPAWSGSERTGRGAQVDLLQTGGQGNRGSQSTAEFERQYPNYQEPIDERLTFSGTITQVPAEGIDLVIETTDGELVVGTGPSALIEHGLEVQEGDELEVMGYWGDDEFKAAEITLLATGQTIVLRDEWGRPSWSGSERTGRGAQVETVQTGGRGSAARDAEGQTVGRGGNGGRNGNDGEIAPGTGQAEVNAWITLQGAVTSIDESALVIQLISGELVTVENRPWWFAQEQGFSAEVGDEIIVTGFYEGENFEAGQLTNISSNLVVDIRQESGRPLWAGGSRSG